ncbi:MAG: DUF1295 domain-containing protein [Gemmatimonadota bacterium]|jgi:protein-S-isoprenylcysteine O-methyltransferase Ste14
MHGERQTRSTPRLVLTAAHAGVVACVVWLLAGLPPGTAPAWSPLASGDAVRRGLLAVLAVVYLIRFSLTSLYLLRRAVDWQEVLIVAPWLAFLHGAVAWLGGTNPRPVSIVAVIGLVLFGAGTAMGPVAEWMRLRWKARPANAGHLYTGGLFRLSMHPNYLGDVLLFAGYALVTGRWVALALPVLVLLSFVFVHVPTLDAYLSSRYGAEFRVYANRTARLVPGVW